MDELPRLATGKLYKRLLMTPTGARTAHGSSDPSAEGFSE
jgi:hypothetical protein